MDRISKVLNPIVLAVSSAWSLATIEQTLSIIILCVNILWILFQMGYKLYKHFKDGNYSEVVNDIKEGADALQELKDNVSEHKEDEK